MNALVESVQEALTIMYGQGFVVPKAIVLKRADWYTFHAYSTTQASITLQLRDGFGMPVLRIDETKPLLFHFDGGPVEIWCERMK